MFSLSGRLTKEKAIADICIIHEIIKHNGTDNDDNNVKVIYSLEIRLIFLFYIIICLYIYVFIFMLFVVIIQLMYKTHIDS